MQEETGPPEAVMARFYERYLLDVQQDGRPRPWQEYAQQFRGFEADIERVYRNLDVLEDALLWNAIDFERFQLHERLGIGGQGTVYKAWDRHLGRFVALKTMNPTFGEEDWMRFERETALLEEQRHAHICRFLDTQPLRGGRGRWISMEFVEGVPLARWIRPDTAGAPSISLRTGLQVMLDVCSGLEYAHDRGIVHRDIKPSNIMCTPAGRGVVLDFGVAKQGSSAGSSELTRTGALVGTPPYMSPEQLRGEPLDQRTDIWSLGVVLHELLLGCRPFAGSSHVEIYESIRSSRPSLLRHAGLPRPLRSLLIMCLAADRSERPRSCGEVARQIHAFLDEHEDSPSLPLAASDRPVARRQARRAAGRWLQPSFLVIAALLIGTLIWLGNGPDRSVGAAITEESSAEHSTASTPEPGHVAPVRARFGEPFHRHGWMSHEQRSAYFDTASGHWVREASRLRTGSDDQKWKPGNGIDALLDDAHRYATRDGRPLVEALHTFFDAIDASFNDERAMLWFPKSFVEKPTGKKGNFEYMVARLHGLVSRGGERLTGWRPLVDASDLKAALRSDGPSPWLGEEIRRHARDLLVNLSRVRPSLDYSGLHNAVQRAAVVLADLPMERGPWLSHQTQLAWEACCTAVDRAFATRIEDEPWILDERTAIAFPPEYQVEITLRTEREDDLGVHLDLPAGVVLEDDGRATMEGGRLVVRGLGSVHRTVGLEARFTFETSVERELHALVLHGYELDGLAPLPESSPIELTNVITGRRGGAELSGLPDGASGEIAWRPIAR